MGLSCRSKRACNPCQARKGHSVRCCKLSGSIHVRNRKGNERDP
jgi:hypothetical protein